MFYSHLRLPQPRGPSPCIYIPQEQGGPVIPLGTGFPFCRLLWLAGLRRRNSNPPPHRLLTDFCRIEYWLLSRAEVKVESEFKVTLRPTVSWPVYLGVRPTSGTCDQFFFLLEIFFIQLWVCYFVAPSLTRGQVCNLLLLLVLASAVTLGLPFLTIGQVCLLSAFC
jgi:hypothetical protein